MIEIEEYQCIYDHPFLMLCSESLEHSAAYSADNHLYEIQRSQVWY